MENILNVDNTNSNDDIPYLAVNNDVTREFIFATNNDMNNNNILSLEHMTKSVN